MTRDELLDELWSHHGPFARHLSLDPVIAMDELEAETSSLARKLSDDDLPMLFALTNEETLVQTDAIALLCARAELSPDVTGDFLLRRLQLGSMTVALLWAIGATGRTDLLVHVLDVIDPLEVSHELGVAAVHTIAELGGLDEQRRWRGYRIPDALREAIDEELAYATRDRRGLRAP